MEISRRSKITIFLLAFLLTVLIFLIFIPLVKRNSYSIILDKVKSNTIAYYEANETVLRKYSQEFHNQKEIVYIRYDIENSKDELIFYVRSFVNKDKLYKLKLNKKDLLLPDTSYILQEEIDIEESEAKLTLQNFETITSAKINFIKYWAQILIAKDLNSVSKNMWFNNSIVFGLINGGKLINNYDSIIEYSNNGYDHLEKIDSDWYFYFVRDTAGFF